MTDPRPARGRSLQARLTLYYAAGIFVAGLVVVVIVAVPLAGIQSTAPVGRAAPGAVTGTGNGVGPHRLLAGSAVALAVLVPIALAGGWFVAGRFLRPLRSITATARVISAGNLHQRLDLGEPTDELTELGRILDDLFARLQAAFDAQRHFVANASHELRTPLAGLRTLLEVALADPDADAGTLRSACEEALALGGHQERLVQALLALATSDRGATRGVTVDLAQLVGEQLAPRREQAAQHGVRLAENLMPAATTGDPALIGSLVANLIDNAIRHNHRDGHVEITTQTSGADVTLTVANSGPVVPDDQIQRLFQPFQSLTPDRHGRGDSFGLGLAIVNAVARAHHATLTTRAQPLGGLTITVRFTPSTATRCGVGAVAECLGADGQAVDLG
jgi:signal transduction histidine kinase